MLKRNKRFYDFDNFSLSEAQRALFRNGQRVDLGQKAFDLLLALVKNAGRVQTKEELFREVWPTVDAIDERNLTQQIRKARVALGDDASPGAARYIQTIPRMGYQFIAEVKERVESPAEALQETTVDDPTPESFHRSAGTRTYAFLFPVFVFLLIVLGVAVLARRLLTPSPRPEIRVGRAFVRSTSEGHSPIFISLDQQPDYLTFSRDGRNLFVTSQFSNLMSIIGAQDHKVRVVSLPAEGGPLVTSPDEKLYIESPNNGIMVFDLKARRLRPGFLSTHGGTVWDMALTPDGRKLYLAMGRDGVRRLSPAKNELTQITTQVCPERLAVDPMGLRLYVAYQCAGPKGWKGHDSVEIFDVKDERSVGIVAGLPMVGGEPSVSMDGSLVTLDGWNACEQPNAGCLSVPSRVFYLLRSKDQQVIKTFSFETGSRGPARFLDQSRFMVVGSPLKMIDASTFSVREEWNMNMGTFDRAVMSSGSRLFALGNAQRRLLLLLNVEPVECADSSPELAHLYSGDGTLNDAIDAAALSPVGPVNFAPGRVGQAFSFDGGGAYLDGPRTGHYSFGARDSTLAFYVKFSSLAGEITLLQKITDGEAPNFAVLKSNNDRLMVRFAGTTGSLAISSRNIVNDHWYQVAVTKSNTELALYLDGKLEDKRSVQGVQFTAGARFRVAPVGEGQAPFRGLIDEIRFYDKALSAEELEALYRNRESGVCQL